MITEAIEIFNEFQKSLDNRQSSTRQSTSADDRTWSYKVDLSRFPTKAEDLHINMAENILTLSGKSEVTSENDLKVFSTHIWSKDIEVPDRLVKTTLKAKLTENNQVILSGDLHDSSANITVNLTEAEMD